MKELSIEEKAKAYDEALKIIKECNPDENGFITIYPQEIFPELKVSDDERMRNGLIKLLNCIAEIEYENTFGITKEEALEWVKRQGEDKSIPCSDGTVDNSLEGIINAAIYWGKEAPTENGRILEDKVKGAVDYYCSLIRNNDGWSDNGKQKPADKVELKFHEGDWITNGATNPAQISSIKDGMYFTHNDTIGGDIESIDKEYHLWTIADAKAGDVLVDKNGCINIYKEPCDKTFYYSHGYCYYPNHGYMYEKDGKFVAVQTAIKIEDANPATKEQRDTLMKAMADAGYTFDFEKKELKKVEQKHAAWSEEDDAYLSVIIDDVESQCMAGNASRDMVDKRIDWLKSLKERVQPQSTWKPSDEMLEALYRVIPENMMEKSEDEMLLDKLYQGLKYGRVLSEK